MKSVATPIARFPDPNAIKMPDGKAPPWIAVMQYGQGRTGWVGSPELWRLAAIQDRILRALLDQVHSLPGRRQPAQAIAPRPHPDVLQRGHSAATSASRPRNWTLPSSRSMRRRSRRSSSSPVELEKYPQDIEKLQGASRSPRAKAKFHQKFTHEFRMSREEGARRSRATSRSPSSPAPSKFPPGSWRVDVEIPS